MTLVAKMRLMPRGVHRVDAHLRLEDAGVVDERRQRAELARRGLEQPHDVGLDATSAPTAMAVPPPRSMSATTASAAVAIRSVVDADRVAARGRQAGRRGADAAAAAGHEDRH